MSRLRYQHIMVCFYHLDDDNKDETVAGKCLKITTMYFSVRSRGTNGSPAEKQKLEILQWE